jgi:hypothetical protein
MYELKKIGKVFMSKFVGTGPSSYKKRIYRAVVSQRLRDTGLEVNSENIVFENSCQSYSLKIAEKPWKMWLYSSLWG